MKEVQISISAQINEHTLALNIQATNAIKVGLALRPAAILTQNIETELENEIELNTQESQITNENITDMNLDKEPWKRKERPIHRIIDGTTVVTPTRLSRQQAKTRNQKTALKKTQKTGQKDRLRKV